MATMTKEQLNEHIKTQVLPLIKETAGPLVKDVVAESVAAALKEQVKSFVPPWMNGQDKREDEKPKRAKGEAFGACVRALAYCKHKGISTSEMPEVLKKWELADIADAFVKAQAAGDATAGGYLVPTTFSQDVIDFLRAASVVRKAGAPTLGMPSGTVKIPKVTTGTSASYTGENTNATKSEAVFGQITLSYKKLISLVPVSNDLIQFSSPGADTIIRQDMVRAMATREDQAFLRDNGTDATPKGLRYWTASGNVTAANGTVSLANVTADLGTALLGLLNNNTPMSRPAWFWAPRTWKYLYTVQNSNGFFVYRDEMNQGKFWGWPFYVTTNIPITLGSGSSSEVYIVDMDDTVIGEATTLGIDASSEAAYHDGSNVIAAFSQDQTVVRAIARHDFALRRDTSCAILTGVTWNS